MVELGPTGPAEEIGFTIKDDRPKESKEYVANPCDVSPVTRLGDENFSPPRLDVLARRLKERLGERLDDREITIHRFDTIVLRTKTCQLQGTPMFVIGSVLGSVAPGLDVGLAAAADIMIGNRDSVICRIDGTINGDDFVAKSVVEIEESMTDKSGVGGRHAEIAAAVSQVVDAAAQEIDKQLRLDTDSEKE